MQSKAPDWQFLFGEIEAGNDVQVFLNWSGSGHCVSVTGISWLDADNDQIMELSEGATISFVDPWDGLDKTRAIWQTGLGGEIDIDYAGHTGAYISAAMSVAVVPEPSTLVLLAAGALACLPAYGEGGRDRWNNKGGRNRYSVLAVRRNAQRPKPRGVSWC